MSNTGRSSIQWRRLAAESAAVVLSILLAFSIDAWWDAHKERLRERELLAGLLADFEASRPDLESRLDLARRMASGTALFLDFTEGARMPIRATVPDSLVFAILGGPTYEPATNTLDAALASGEIELIQSAELRSELAHWRRTLADTGEDEREVRRITNEQIVPLLAKVTDLRPYFAMILPHLAGAVPTVPRDLTTTNPPGTVTGHTTMDVTSDLVGAVALRKFFIDFSAGGLETLRESLDRLEELLRRELAD